MGIQLQPLKKAAAIAAAKISWKKGRMKPEC